MDELSNTKPLLLNFLLLFLIKFDPNLKFNKYSDHWFGFKKQFISQRVIKESTLGIIIGF